jgi:HEAT repeat protein
MLQTNLVKEKNMRSLARRLGVFVSLAFVWAAPLSWGKTVGLWKDERSHISDGMLKTLNDAGWQTTILTGNDLSDEAKLAALNVIFLPGGWNASWFADFHARRAMVKFVAGGKGILAGGFRSGYVRTMNRPLLPQVGATYNRVNGPYVSAFGDSELAKAIDRPFCPGGWDHLVVKVGPLGKVFAVNGDDAVGVYGEAYGGRYLVFGAFLGMDAKTNGMEGTARQVLLKSVEWLAAAPQLSAADKAKQEAQADLEFLRREQSWDWTLNERGPDISPGVLPQIRNSLATPLESRQFTLEYMSQYLPGKQLDACRATADALKKAVAELDGNFQKVLADTTARIGKMSLEELTAENPFLNRTNLLKRIEAAVGKTDPEKQSMKDSIADNNAPRIVATFLHGSELAEKLMSAQKLKEMIARGDQVIAEFRPLVKAAKAAKMAEERKRDLAAVPGLIAKCVAPDAAVRRAAVLELGRIGDPKTASALIQALKDTDEKVRINAILGLGWMQSKEAVPALIDALGGKELTMRRRVAQALGQIGDPRASKPLLGLVGDNDCDTAVNAIMSLGWLKAKEAVPELLKIVTTSNPKQAEPRALMLAAIRALGHIGDAAALSALEKLAAEAKDYPDNRRGSKPVANIYSTAQSLGLQGHAQLAVAEIKAGGRSEIGVRQSDFLAAKDKFYRITGEFNALAGRPVMTGAGDVWPYLWEAGLTGIHMAWGEQDADPAEYLKTIAAAGELDLCWIDILPNDGNMFGAKSTYSAVRQQSVEKPGAEVILLEHRNEPAFQGFWYEECYPGIEATAADFETWLVKKYSPDYRKKLGLGKEVVLPSNAQQFSEVMDAAASPLKTDCLEFGADRILEYWRETQDWLRGMRKGCAFTYSISEPGGVSYIGLTGPVGDAIVANGPENYQFFGRDNAFMMELYKDGGARPVMCEFYSWYSPSPAHDIRGFAQHLMHGECFYSFYLGQIFGQAPNGYDLWTWDASRWGNLKRIFQKARRIRDYIAVPASAANVAQLCSESTACHFGEFSSLGARWYQHQSALWTALQQSQIPADVIWAETLTPEKLSRYRVLVMTDAKILTEAQVGLIRDWVNKGGVLIAGGSSTLFDRLPAVRKNYLLADVFGVDYAGFAGVTDPALNDTFCFQQGNGPEKVESSLALPAARHHVHRDIKPVKSLGLYRTMDKATAFLPEIAPGTACEYDMPLGYDKVKPGAAETLAQFANGDPALTVNKIGKGLCYFWTPIYPGLCHVASGWEMQANQKDFWPNVRELLAAMVRGGLGHQQASLPVEVTGVSKDVEVTVRQQPEHSRWMIHLLDYDPRSNGVKGVAMTVHPPAGRTVKRIFYPDTQTEVPFVAAEAGVTATLRDFEVHDMVVTELAWGEE